MTGKPRLLLTQSPSPKGRCSRLSKRMISYTPCVFSICGQFSAYMLRIRGQRRNLQVQISSWPLALFVCMFACVALHVVVFCSVFPFFPWAQREHHRGAVLVCVVANASSGFSVCDSFFFRQISTSPCFSGLHERFA